MCVRACLPFEPANAWCWWTHRNWHQICPAAGSSPRENGLNRDGPISKRGLSTLRYPNGIAAIWYGTLTEPVQTSQKGSDVAKTGHFGAQTHPVIYVSGNIQSGCQLSELLRLTVSVGHKLTPSGRMFFLVPISGEEHTLLKKLNPIRVLIRGRNAATCHSSLK